MPNIEEIRRMAHDYWNFDMIPTSQVAIALIQDYIRNHPDEFRGAQPQ